MESGDARREEHARRLAEPLSAGAARGAATPFRAVALDAAAAAHAAGRGAGARHQPARAVRHPRRQRERRRRVRGEYAAAADRVLNGTGREAFDAMQDAARGRRPVAVSRPRTAPTIRARAFGQALRQIAQLVKADVGLEVAFADSAAGTRTSTRARRRASSRPGSTTSRAASRRSSPTSAIAWPTPSS